MIVIDPADAMARIEESIERRHDHLDQLDRAIESGVEVPTLTGNVRRERALVQGLLAADLARHDRLRRELARERDPS